jgi:hypothetical protein
MPIKLDQDAIDATERRIINHMYSLPREGLARKDILRAIRADLTLLDNGEARGVFEELLDPEQEASRAG